MRRTALMLAALFIASVVFVEGATPTGAAPGASDMTKLHCNARVIGQTGDGELQLSSPNCFKTEREARMEVAGGDSEARLMTTYIAIHYDGTSYGGGSIGIIGSSCTGGGINWATYSSGTWNNRFESSKQYCAFGSYVWYYDQSSCSGLPAYRPNGWEDKSTLGSLNNLTSCTLYGP